MANYSIGLSSQKFYSYLKSYNLAVPGKTLLSYSTYTKFLILIINKISISLLANRNAFF
jgi:hypothetical protein